MPHISRLTETVVRCETLLAWSAIAAVVLALMPDPAFAFRTGAFLAALLGVGLEIKARLCHRWLVLEENDIWRSLSPDHRPPEALAHALIVIAMRRELQRKAWATMAGAGVLLVACASAGALGGG